MSLKRMGGTWGREIMGGGGWDTYPFHLKVETEEENLWYTGQSGQDEIEGTRFLF